MDYGTAASPTNPSHAPSSSPRRRSPPPKLEPPSSLNLDHSLSDDHEPRVLRAPSSPVRVHTPTSQVPAPSAATIESGAIKLRPSAESSAQSYAAQPPKSPVSPVQRKPLASPLARLGPHAAQLNGSVSSPTSPTALASPIKPFGGTHVRNISAPVLDKDPLDQAMENLNFGFDQSRSSTPTIQLSSAGGDVSEPEAVPHLPYHHEKMHAEETRKQAARKTSHATTLSIHSSSSDGYTVSSAGDRGRGTGGVLDARNPSSSSRPPSQLVPGPDLQARGRSPTPQGLLPEGSRPFSNYERNLSASSLGRSPDARPVSTVDLLNIPYAQQMAHQMVALDNARLQGSVGSNAALLDPRKTLEMYRANVKKTNDLSLQYEFAIFMVNAAQESSNIASGNVPASPKPDSQSLAGAGAQKDLLKEARLILQRLADKSYPYAQYYLADGYASGLFNNGKPSNDKAFGLFLAAGKHGHAEAAYRAALSYEYGWGASRDIAKAVQFYRQAAAKGHPGAAVRLGKACLTGDMGLIGKHREGIKWLKRAAENADAQHNAGLYELGLLHVTGYGDDIFKDEGYAAQLFTRAAELGHADANMRMGEVYEHGLLTCPRDPALSIHFYHGAAEQGLPEAMMALCAWYMVGAEPVLDKDEAEAYEWAKQAADTGMPKAEYAMGYFTEMGIGCRRDPLEANVWYLKAADQGDERARHRLAIIRAAESGAPEPGNLLADRQLLKKKRSALGGDKKDDKDCMVM